MPCSPAARLDVIAPRRAIACRTGPPPGMLRECDTTRRNGIGQFGADSRAVYDRKHLTPALPRRRNVAKIARHIVSQPFGSTASIGVASMAMAQLSHDRRVMTDRLNLTARRWARWQERDGNAAASRAQAIAGFLLHELERQAARAGGPGS